MFSPVVWLLIVSSNTFLTQLCCWNIINYITSLDILWLIYLNFHKYNQYLLSLNTEVKKQDTGLFCQRFYFISISTRLQMDRFEDYNALKAIKRKTTFAKGAIQEVSKWTIQTIQFSRYVFNTFRCKNIFKRVIQTCNLLCKGPRCCHRANNTKIGRSLDWAQFMLQWFVTFPQFAEFTVFNEGSAPCGKNSKCLKTRLTRKARSKTCSPDCLHSMPYNCQVWWSFLLQPWVVSSLNSFRAVLELLASFTPLKHDNSKARSHGATWQQRHRCLRCCFHDWFQTDFLRQQRRLWTSLWWHRHRNIVTDNRHWHVFNQFLMTTFMLSLWLPVNGH